MNLIKQFIMFCGVGSINTIVALFIILILSEVFLLQYLISNLLGYIVGLIIGFFLHRNFTFSSSKNDSRKFVEFLKFSSIFLIAYSTQFAGLWTMVEILNIPNLISQIFAVMIYVIINFLGNRVFVFTSREGASEG